MDERFEIHRLKATRLAAIAGVLTACGWYLYSFLAHGLMRYDLFVVMIVMGVVKVGAMAYYRKAN